MTKPVILGLLGMMIVIDGIILGLWPRPTRPLMSALPVYNEVTLAKFDGTHQDLPIYLALDGYVYDVTGGRDDYYGHGEAYHYLAGKDASQPLHLFGAELIRRKYQVVGVYQP